MSKQWLVLADESQARIYAIGSGTDLQLIETLENASAHKQAHDLGSDRPGRRVDGFGHRHALGGEQDPKRLASERFAHEVATYLATARRAGKLDALTLIMAARFLGLLRHALDAECAKLVRLVVRKDWMHCSEAELRDDLHEALSAGA